MSVRKPVMANKPSSLLSHNENETLFKLLGTRCQSLTSAIVQVFGTDGPNHNVWRKRCCGVATFTKDNTRRSYYIQVYDVIAGTRLYEQEVYNQFSYNSSMPFFHQFEAEDQMIGLNFADEGEASAFNQAVSERLAAKQRRREERKRQSDQQQRHQQHIPQQHQQQQQLGQSQQEPLKPVQPSAYVPPYVPQKEIKRKTNKRANKNKNKLSKEQIGMPMDFKHITHVGFDPDKGFSQFNVDEKLQTFFNMVGVSQQQLSDARTREFIYDFIEKNGGVEKAVQETQRYSTGPMLAGLQTDSSQLLPPTTHTSPPTPPSVPSRNSFSGSRAAPPPPPRNNHAPPPPPPVTAPPPPPPHPRAPMPPPPGQIIAGQKTTPLPPTPPSSVPPPLPPTSTIPSHPHLSAGRAAPPPPPPSVVTPSSGIVPSHPPPPPPPHPVGAGPAPPPPPPPPGGPPPPPGGPPPPPQPPGPPGALDARSALMDQIRSGSTLKSGSQHSLKKVEPVERAPVQDSRSQLLDEIRLGKSLKKVEDAEGGRNRSSEPQLEGMALDLHRALMGRALAMQSDTDSSNDDEDEDEEDEWDDED